MLSGGRGHLARDGNRDNDAGDMTGWTSVRYRNFMSFADEEVPSC